MTREHIMVRVGDEQITRLCEHPRAEAVAQSLTDKGFRCEDAKYASEDMCEDCVILIVTTERELA